MSSIAPSQVDHRSENAVLNVAAYKFVSMSNLSALRAELKHLCADLELRGTIMLSPEGINLFVAGPIDAVHHLIDFLRALPELADLEVKESFSSSQPFNRMLVKLKREIIAFGIAAIQPARQTSPKLPPEELKQWFHEGRKFRLLDTRNVYEVELGTFEGAEHLNLHHFREFPTAISQLPEEAKEEPLVMFCTGGIRCEKAGPMMEQAGFKRVYQLEGGILKYFEKCGGDHYQGACFVFDNRVALDPELKPTGDLLCFACQAVITHEDVASPHFKFGEYCPKCYLTPRESYEKRIAQRQKQIDAGCRPLPGSIPYENIRRVHVPARYEGKTLIDFLDAWLPAVGRHQWLAWIGAGQFAKQSGGDNRLQPVTSDVVVHQGECYVQLLPNTTEPNVSTEIQLIHEDTMLVVVNKPAPLPSHPSGRFNFNTLSHLVGLAYRPEKLRLAHRLDANTTGVMVFCRKHAASKFVQPQFSDQTVRKVYLARVHGHPNWKSYRCDAPISESPGTRGSRRIDADGQSAVTEFRLRQQFEDGTSLLEIEPLTGRTNQIRIHLWHLGHAIVGDSLYLPNQQIGDRPTIDIQATPMCLHAWKITLTHPESKQPVTYTAAQPAWVEKTGDAC